MAESKKTSGTRYRKTPAKKPKKTEISTKKARITREVTRLKKLFNDIDENKKKLVETTIKDVAFMTVEMQDLREEITKNGSIEEYKNGANQFGRKTSAASQNYLQFSQKQTAAMKILLDQLPKTEPKKPDAGDFEDFVYNRAEV